MELATAFVAIRPDASSFESELVAAIAGIGEQDISVTADVEEAQGEIESLDGGDVEVEVGAVTDPAQAEIDGLDGGEVEVKVKAETAEAKSKIDDLGGAVEGLVSDLGPGSGALANFGTSALGAAGASAAAVTGAGALAVGLGISANAAMEAEVSTALLSNTLAQSGADAYLTADAVGALAMEIQGYSGLSDEAIQDAARMLLSFANVRTEAAVTSGVFDRATRSVADIARFMGSDAVTAAGMLGRALDNPVTGVTALTRARVSFTEAERAAIIAMAESGDIIGAQNALLTAVEGNVKGAAAAYGDTLAGDVDKAKESIGNLSEEIGNSALPALGALADFLAGAAEGFRLLNADLEEGPLTEMWESFMAPDWDPALDFNLEEVLGKNASGEIRETTEAVAAFTEAQQAANDAVAATLPTLGGIISETDRAGEAFGVLNASSDPQAIIDNLSLALFAWDDFQNNITTIDEWGPRIAGALQGLGPEVAGGLTNALAEGNIATIVQLDGLIAQIEAKGGEASAVLTGFAQSGMSGAVAAVQSSAPAMGAAGQDAGAAGAAGIDGGLAFTNASNIGNIVGVQYAGAVASGIAAMAPAVDAVADNMIAGAGNISSAFSRGQSLGSAYGSGVVAGLAGQVGAVAANRALIDAAAADVGRGSVGRSSVSKDFESGAALGAGVGRSSVSSVAPAALPPVQVVVDGQVVAEASFEHNRRLAMAEGYEQP